jgi:ABC-type Co2+ transport system permease subunit
MGASFDFNELIKRAIKYIIEGLAVALVALLIPRKQLNVEEIVIIALTAAAVFSILDVFIPSAGAASRVGFGAVSGANLGGGLLLAA